MASDIEYGKLDEQRKLDWMLNLRIKLGSVFVILLDMRAIVLSILIVTSCFGRAVSQSSEPLLTNMKIQFECTEAVDSLYNFKFDVAEQQFQWLKQQYPDHPLPYFLLGLSQWWHIVPNDDVETYDKAFLAYMDTSITHASRLYAENSQNPEASFFLAAAYGFKARLQSDREHYGQATFSTKQSLNYLNEHKDLHNEFGPEFLFGTALYNYFRVWIPENKPFLKPIVMFFPKGDKELGLKQLESVSKDAFYTRIEAMNFLVKIRGSYEKDTKEALPTAKYLYSNYPNNAYFAREYAKLNFMGGSSSVTEEVSKEILDKIAKGKPGFESESGRLSSFFLGSIYRTRKDTVQSMKYLKQCLDFTYEAGAQGRGYHLYALQYLAQFHDAQGDIIQASNHYRVVKALADRDHRTYKKAKKYLKEHKKEYKKRLKNQRRD